MRLLRLALEKLEPRSRVERGNAKALIGLAIADLEHAVDDRIQEATRDLGKDLLLALGPSVTWAEIAGARGMLG